MNTGQLATVLVSVLVCGVLIAGMIPIFGDVSASEDTFVNKGLFYIEDTAEELNYTYENKVLYLNGEAITIPSNVSDGTTILYTDKLIIRAYANDMRFRGVYDYNATSFDITISNGSITGEVTTTSSHSISTTYSDHFYGITNQETDVVMTSASMDPYFKTDTVLSNSPLIHPTEFGNDVYMIVYVHGSIDDGLTFSLIDIHRGYEMTNYTVSDYEVIYSPVRGYEDLYKFEGISYTISTVPGEGEESVSAQRVMTTVALDVEQTAERTAQMDGPTKTMIQMIPLIAVVGLILATIGYVLYKRL